MRYLNKLDACSDSKKSKHALAEELLPPVEQQHNDDDDAVDHLAAEFLDLHDRENRLQEGDQDDAGDGAEIGAAPAHDGGAAEDDGGDGGQEIGIAHGLRRLARIAGEEN